MHQKTLDIIGTIASEIETDYKNGSKSLANMYEHGTPAEQVIIDAVLIDVCGWDFSGLVELAGMRGMYVKEGE